MIASAERLANWLAQGETCWLYSTDPGGHACLRVVADTLATNGTPFAWITEGWCREHGGVVGVSWDEAEPAQGGRVLIGAQLDFVRTRTVLRMCRERGLQSLYLFDAWAHYATTFCAAGEPPALPDVIGVPDELARTSAMEALTKHGIDAADQVRVVGHPDLERVANEITATPQDAVAGVRAEFGVEGGPLLVFLTEPIEADWGLDTEGRPPLGLTELTVLDTFLETQVPSNATVLIRPHPRQDRKALVTWLEPRLAGRGIHVSQGASLPVELAAADMVFGMFTSALLAADLAGKPTRSLQWGRNAHGRSFSNPHLERMIVNRENDA